METTHEIKHPLYEAMLTDDHECFLSILKLGNYDVNTPDVQKRTPFMIAAKVCKDHSILKILMENGANRFERDMYGYTALHYCMGNAKATPEMIALCVVREEVVVDAAGFLDVTPRNEVATDIILSVPDSTQEKCTITMVKPHTNMYACVSYFVTVREIGFDTPSKSGVTPLFIAAQGDKLSMILSRYPDDINITARNTTGETVLHMCLKHKNTAGIEAVYQFCKSKEGDVFRELLSAINANGKCVIYRAIKDTELRAQLMNLMVSCE